MTMTIALIATIIIGALFGLGLTMLFWVLMMQQDRSISKRKDKDEDEKEYIYEFYLNEDDDRVN